ncbi:MAG: gamma carbonic anhydrase family protein [Christensenellaceae bacterium]|jgi:carbonic anhydrase/acetyltransferase-like protein (isoleucine patch superfamily)
MITKVSGKTPNIAESAYVHKSAVVIGNVEICDGASVWPGAVVRGDMHKIVIGRNTNIQDNSVLHTEDRTPLLIGEDVVVGHNACLHSCTVGNNCLIGIGSIVLDGAKIGNNCVVAAGALVPPGKEFPDGSMIMGAPAKVAREVTAADMENRKYWRDYYFMEKERYRETEEEL